MVNLSLIQAAVSSLVRSPFQGHEAGRRSTRDGAVGVLMSACTLVSVTLISTWHAGVDAMSQAVGAGLGVAVVDLPGVTGQTFQCPMGLLMRVGPQEFWLVADDAQTDMTAKLREHVRADVGSVTNLSHARCRIRIDGANCLDVLGKLFALDLRESTFPPGDIRLSGHHHVPCTLHRLGLSAFDLYVFSTYGHDQLATLVDAALEYGVDLTSIG